MPSGEEDGEGEVECREDELCCAVNDIKRSRGGHTYYCKE